MMVRGMRSLGAVVISGLAVKAASLIKVSYIVGSYAAFFSGTCVAMPLIGALGGGAVSLLTCIASFFLGGGISLHLLAHHIPGLCAAFYWTTSSFLLRVGLPLICFTLFVTHPIGLQAFPYACYWVIPMALYFVKRKTVFLEALGSTFTAHAVGSVIWLYSTSLPAQAWLALMPIVALERLVFATAMVVVHGVIVRLKSRVSSMSLPRISTIYNQH